MSLSASWMTQLTVVVRDVAPDVLSPLIDAGFVRIIGEKSAFEGRERVYMIETDMPDYVRACLARLLTARRISWYSTLTTR